MTSKPDKIEYIWNGANQYVYDWMTHHFDPISKCPIAVQKYASEDDWDSHVYILNVEKVLKYFEIKQKKGIDENDTRTYYQIIA